MTTTQPPVVQPPVAADAPRGRARAALVVIALFVALGSAAALAPGDLLAGALAGLEEIARGPWAAPAAIAAFVILASLGVPQVVVVTALVAAVGPFAGFLYSWIGKVISCAIGFFVGRRFGAAAVARHASPALAAVMADLARHGFWASALVRLVPTVPSVVVNVAAGATPMGFTGFIAGAAVGSVPKLALIAFAGHSALAGLSGGGLQAWLALGGAMVGLLGVGWLGRRWFDRRLARARAEAGAEG